MYCVERESFINVIQLKRGIEEKLNNLRIYNFKAFPVNKFFETIMAKMRHTSGEEFSKTDLVGSSRGQTCFVARLYNGVRVPTQNVRV